MKSAVLEREITRIAPKTNDEEQKNVSTTASDDVLFMGAPEAAPKSVETEDEITRAKDILFGATREKEETVSSVRPEPVRDMVSERAVGVPSAPVSSAADRIADYHASPLTRRKEELFGGVYYQHAPAWDEVATKAKVMDYPDEKQEEAEIPPYEPVPADYMRLEEAPKAGFWANVEARWKLAVAAVAAVIVLAIVLICVNTNLISALNKDVNVLRTHYTERVAQEQAIDEQITDVTSYENVSDFATSKGATLGD